MTKITKGSGNVFEDLGLPGAEDLHAKAEITRQIYTIIKEGKLTQKAAAKRLGIAQPDVSNLMNGRFTGFSTERLFHLLNALDRDVEIIIRRKPAKQKTARVKVVAA
ncbi:MAG: helix-turn-helix domain-containing protein [Alphaproteobacteria bacterium]